MEEFDLDLVEEEFKVMAEGAIEHLQKQLQRIRSGVAAPQMLEGVMVQYYGAPVPINQVANIMKSDSRTLTIQPFEKKSLADIEKGIFEANLGFTPMNDGEVVRISIAPPTEEGRKKLAKQANAEGEDAKVSVRNVRQKIMKAIKDAVKKGFSEDAGKRMEEEIEKEVKGYVEKIDKIVKEKEKEIMTV